MARTLEGVKQICILGMKHDCHGLVQQDAGPGEYQ